MSQAQAADKKYAVIEVGGSQYLVRQNSMLKVNQLEATEGSTIELDRVLALSDGTALTVGKPLVKNAKVTCLVVRHTKGDKVVSFKKKRRKGYKRKVGHRQCLTELKVEKI